MQIKNLVRGSKYLINFAADHCDSYSGPATFLYPCDAKENECYEGETGVFLCHEGVEEEGWFQNGDVVELLEKCEFHKLMDQLGISGIDEETVAKIISLYNENGE